MAITREYGANGGTNPTTSTTVTIPAGCQTGDILILAATNRGATADPSVTDNDTGGNTWVKIANQNAATNGAGTVWWKRATSGTASKTITVSGMTNSMTCVLAGFRGASDATTSPYNAASGEANASGDESHAAYTTDRNESMVILTVHDTGNDTNNPTSYTATDPTTLTESGEHTSSGGLDCSTSLAYAIKSTAGSTGTISWSQTNSTSASIVFELRIKPVVVAGSGSYAETGTDATLKRTYKVQADSGAYTETGTAATLRKNLPIVAGSGSYAETGTDATLKRTYKVQADSGAYAETGADASLERGLKITAGAGAYTETGTDADLVYTPVTGYTLTADPGTYVETGTDATQKRTYVASAASGTYAVTGTDATQDRTYVVTGGVGSFTESGTAASLERGLKLTAGAGAYTETGTAATLTKSLAARAGSDTWLTRFVVNPLEPTMFQVSPLETPQSPEGLMHGVSAYHPNNVLEVRDMATSTLGTLTKDPSDEIDYTVDWRTLLSALNDSISSVAWTHTGLTSVAASTHTSTHATVWLGGGTAGTDYTVTCEITTNGGRVIQRSFALRVVDL